MQLRKITRLLQDTAQNDTVALENNLVLINVPFPSDPASSLLGIYLREMKDYVHTEACMQMFITLFTHNHQELKQPKDLSPGKGQIHKYIPPTGYRSAIKTDPTVDSRDSMNETQVPWVT